jgi:hypothetical protein
MNGGLMPDLLLLLIVGAWAIMMLRWVEIMELVVRFFRLKNTTLQSNKSYVNKRR